MSKKSDELFHIAKLKFNEGATIDQLKAVLRLEILNMSSAELELQGGDLSKTFKLIRDDEANFIVIGESSEISMYYNHFIKCDLHNISKESDTLKLEIKSLNDRLRVIEKIKDEKFGDRAIIKLIISAIRDIRFERITDEHSIVDI